MIAEKVLLERIQSLPAHRQQEVLDFADFLAQKEPPPNHAAGLKGLWNICRFA